MLPSLRWLVLMPLGRLGSRGLTSLGGLAILVGAPGCGSCAPKARDAEFVRLYKVVLPAEEHRYLLLRDQEAAQWARCLRSIEGEPTVDPSAVRILEDPILIVIDPTLENFELMKDGVVAGPGGRMFAPLPCAHELHDRLNPERWRDSLSAFETERGWGR